jgi:hypothetical protein
MAARWGYGTARRCIQTFLALLLTTPLVGVAGPRVLEESFRITRPDPSYDWPIAVATDGDWLLATGARYELDTGLTNNATWLYQRQFDGSWTLVRQLHQFSFQEDYDEPPIQLALKTRSSTHGCAVPPRPGRTTGLDSPLDIEMKATTIT